MLHSDVDVVQWLREKAVMLNHMAEEIGAMHSLSDSDVRDRVADLLADKTPRRPIHIAHELRIADFVIRRVVTDDARFVVNSRGWISLSRTGGNGDVPE